VKTLHYSIPPSSFCTRQSPTVSCLETAVLIYDHFQMHETQSKNSWRRELWMFQTRTTSPPIVGSCAEEAPCEICELLDCACARDAPCFPLPRSNSPRASPSPAACTQPGGTTNVQYTRRIRLDVFHIQEYVLIIFNIFTWIHTYVLYLLLTKYFCCKFTIFFGKICQKFPQLHTTWKYA